MAAAHGRGRILAAARTLFAEQGFDRTSTAQIAAAAQVPHGLIFYHFKTKMDLLLAIIRDDAVTALDGLLPDPEPGASLQEAVADLWLALTGALGRPSPVRRVVIQEMAAHPEVRQRARELHEAITSCVRQYLARASGHPGAPGPEHDAAARLLTIAASVAPLLDECGQPVIPPGALAAVIAGGLARTEPASPSAGNPNAGIPPGLGGGALDADAPDIAGPPGPGACDTDATVGERG